MLRGNKLSFKRSLVKFATVLSVFFTGISFINVPLQTQTVQAASQSKTEKRNAVVKLAKEQVGKSYVYGATGPSAFDCSGLAQYVYKKAAKKTLPRTTYGQVTKGKRVSLSHLKKGDLLFWGSASAPYHVGIYVGDGKMIHSPQTGDVVKISALHKNYVCARRYL